MIIELLNIILGIAILVILIIILVKKDKKDPPDSFTTLEECLKNCDEEIDLLAQKQCIKKCTE